MAESLMFIAGAFVWGTIAENTARWLHIVTAVCLFAAIAP
jgi:uncharacterized membrane protein YjjB (DUF3815 family)